ncbi:MAG: tRNA (adenosine(37)-N6)-dimethylallyltransferase MiaA [Desulfobacteraceae bacterium]|nr:MAG: tRNA (adenosine(37)-N6)-dimethylallyltransferase MiaA [Desulfobacteraceae bacterium]
MNQKPSLIVICGPTGIGKTSAGIEAAETFGGEIISADSMQIYKRMDIGTAKPTREERARISHHMIDIIEPDEEFSAAKFALTAGEITERIRERGRISFLVGGTGLYIKALVHGLFHPGISPSGIRSRLKHEAETDGPGALYKRLLESDREAADKIHPNDTFRIIRALEVYETTGMTISEHHKKHAFSGNRFNVLKIGLTTEREDLYKRIEKRVDLMIEAGFAEEVKRLLEMNYAASLKSMQSIGYRHMVEYVTGRIPLDEMVRTLKQDTRRFAKRQMTWFNADPEIVWLKPDQVNDIKMLVGSFLKATGK